MAKSQRLVGEDTSEFISIRECDHRQGQIFSHVNRWGLVCLSCIAGGILYFFTSSSAADGKITDMRVKNAKIEGDIKRIDEKLDNVKNEILEALRKAK